MTLIAVTGYKNSGKNAVCNVLAKEYGYVITGFADALKAQMYAIDPWIPVIRTKSRTMARLSTCVDEFGWDAAKEIFPEIRRLLQRAGTEGGRDIFGENIWVDTWYKKTKVLLEQGYDVCVSDMRFLNEAAAVRDLGGRVWRVKRSGTERGEHLSESQLDEIRPDLILRNDQDLEALSLVVGLVMP